MYIAGFVNQEYISMWSYDIFKTIIMSNILKKTMLIFYNFWLTLDTRVDLNVKKMRL